MNEMRGQLPRPPLQAAAAEAAEMAATGGRTTELRSADRRFTRNLLLSLLGLEIVNGITIVLMDAAVPDNTAEISPWVTFAVRLGISLLLYGLAYRGFRVAWWLTWVRILVGTAAFVFFLPDSFDFVSLLFTLVFLGFGAMLAFSPRVVSFRKDRRIQRPVD